MSAARHDPRIATELESYRPALTRVVQSRLDPRLRRRVAVSDVLQSVFQEAHRRLSLRGERPEIAMGLWLHELTTQHLIQLYRKHFGAQRRDLRREVPIAQPWPEASSIIAGALAGRSLSPSQISSQEEERQRLICAIEQLKPADHEVLSLRHFDGFDNKEVAELLDLSESSREHALHARTQTPEGLARRRHGLRSWNKISCSLIFRPICHRQSPATRVALSNARNAERALRRAIRALQRRHG
jgi:RNA polymerase sigma-70 factor (ECF subfamily)